MKITDDTLAAIDGGGVRIASRVLYELADTYEDPDAPTAIILRAAANLAELRGIEVLERVLA